MNSWLLIFLATVIYCLAHSLLATLGAKSWAQRRFGIAANRWYRLAYNLFAVISGLPILGLLIALPDQMLYKIPFPLIYLTILGQSAGILIIVIGIWQTDLWKFVGLRQISKPDGSSSSEMTTDGLYRWVRHPLYTGGLLLIWLVPMMTLNLLILIVLLTIYLVVGAKLEEKRLIHEYGDRYLEYQKCVPMLLPMPWKKKNT